MHQDKKRFWIFFQPLKYRKTRKRLVDFFGFFQYFKAFMPRLGEHLLPSYKLLRQENKTVLTPEHHKSIDEKKAGDLSLLMATLNAQEVILTDASLYAAGYVLMIADYITD